MGPHWTTYLTAMMTPVVACFGAWIAYQQWITARDKLRLDLYERRMAVFTAAWETLGVVFTRGDLTREDESTYLQGTAGAQWLFGKEIQEYLGKEFWGQLCELHRYVAEMDGLPPGPQRSELSQKKLEQRKWFYAQSDRMEKLFHPYLGFEHRSISLARKAS